MYLLLVIGGAIVFLPQLIGHEPTARGVIPSVLGGLWVLACCGLRYPLQMLPILLFELLWKTIWLIDYGLPQWRAGVHTTQFAEDFKAIALGVILIPIIPWGYVFRHYRRCRGHVGARHREYWGIFQRRAYAVARHIASLRVTHKSNKENIQ